MGARDLLKRVVRRVLEDRPTEPVVTRPAGGVGATVRPETLGGGATSVEVGPMALPPVPESTLEDGLEVEVPVPGSILLDVREPGELAGGVAVGAVLLPMDMLPHYLHTFPKDRAITVYCAAGARSAGVAHWMREQGWPGAVSLAGGIGALRFGGVEVRVPPGIRPGTKVSLADGLAVDGVVLGPGRHRLEVIEQVGDRVRARAFDSQGFQVEVVVPIGAVAT
jgi:rhodanese-related sulfurtransferase